MGLRIWLDDVRPMPKGFDIWCKTADDCLYFVRHDNVEHISFDHDLGQSDGSGYFVASVIDGMAYSKEVNQISWDIHSANPVGRKNIEAAMKSAERFWNIK